MEVVEAHQALLGHDTHQGQRHALIIIPFDHFKEVDTQNLKHHYEVLPVSSMVQKAVQKLHAVAVFTCDVFELLWLLLIVLLERVEPFGFHPVAGGLIENLDLIEGRHEVVTRRSLNFHCHVSVVLDVLREPHSGEVAPAELLNDQVAIDEHLAYMHRVIASKFVIWKALIFRAVRVPIETGTELVPKWRHALALTLRDQLFMT
mmetsp:Transcript_26483/g.35418  ORF Transcript_26483/g.35418 Transcript_26483/m.35418 type:complete len:204 (-) Transcript_26483:296-907(-)|eukprot:CAMPEP_0185581942 /NCGR_PEP_ID=MMETSP0434-20130131/19386_1 /TAXON_ID=626734 ORGANISM="Favella taraikaensis, Strain Fe Narragansett Bay" /NCGR_SAMPLE_ID=MMETSP0434 /ASSEMBLY_ACC=CAM_ASM_000379 /LENGTH=203 /DNA_ID=CAMNT_0028200607 /DNA_START=2117 /DNA_END=2728 /DNA_ORIENTATION=-